MADQKITALNELAEADVASTDVLPIADVSASETKKVTVKSLVEQGVDLIDDASIPAAKLASISPSSLGSSSGAKEFIAGPTGAGGAYTSRVIAATDLPAATASALGGAAAGTGLTSTSGTFSVDPATASARGAISVPSASGLSVDGSGVISHQSSVTGQTKNGFTVNDSGHITAVGSIAAGDLPKATSSAVGGVFVGSGLSVTASGQLNHTDSITAGTTSGITFNSEGHITATAALAASDLPAGTTSAKGGVSVPSGALSVSGAGALTHDNSGVTAGTYPKVTVDARGHVTAGTTLSASDIPDISAAKLTSGTIGTSLIANDAVTGGKLADGSSVRFAGAPDTNGVVDFGTADFNGQFLYDAYNENLYLYDGNAFKSIDIVSGEIVFAGTYDASTNLVASVTAKGTAIGLTVGQALIAPAASNLNHYLTVSVSGTGSGNAPAEALAPPDFLLSTGTSWQVLDLSTALAATSANNVSFSPTGNVAATNVQAAIEELDTEKLAANNPNMTGTATFAGNVVLGTASSLTFEGSSADDYETTFAITNPTADRTITFPNVTGTIITTGDSGTVTNTMLAGSIALTKLANITSGQLIIGNTSNVPTAVAMSGDATISNTGALTIANDAVTAAKLADTSVTAGSYTAADITVDAQGRITAAASGTIGTAEIADDAVTADKLADTSVTAGSYTAADITVDAQGRVTAAASGTIGTSEIADTAVTTAKIADDAVTAAKLADTAVTAGSYTAADITVDAQGRITAAAAGTISTSEIADDAVTAAKLADTAVTAGSYTAADITVDAQGRITAAASGSSGGSTFDATASGAIANGDTCIVKSDGNVAAVAKTVTTKTTANFVITSIADIVEESTFSFRSVYASGSSAVLTTYRHNTGDEQHVRAVFTSGTTVTYSPETLLQSSVGEFSSVVYDENADRAVVFYRRSNGSLNCKVIQINGSSTAPTAGAQTEVDSGVIEENFDTSYDANAGKIVVVFRESTNNKPVIRVGTVNASDNSISFGTAVNAVTTTGKHNSIVYDANSQKHVHVYTNSSNDFEAKVFTVSGTSGSYGSATTITTSNPHSTKGVFDSAQNKVFFAFRDDSIGDAGKCVAGNVSGTSVTFGSVVNIDDVDITTLDVDFDTDVQKVVIGYGEKITNNLEVTRANISGTTVTIDTNKDTAAQTGTIGIGVTYDKSAEKLVLTFRDPGNGYGGTRLVTMADTSTNLTATNYIGIADAAYSNGNTATIQIIGAVDDAQSGLTPGLQYYVQADGSLGTGAGTPSVFAGTAVSATKLIVKG